MSSPTSLSPTRRVSLSTSTDADAAMENAVGLDVSPTSVAVQSAGQESPTSICEL
jgi:hypothetical protein